MILTPDWPAPKNIRAAITTRQGGKSSGAYSSFNLGTHVQDDPANVEANRQLLCQQLQLQKVPQWLEQIHGNKIVEAQADGRVRTADACFTREHGLACVVMTADCLPVLICDNKGTQVAAVHCGWRSLSQSILEKTIATFSASPKDLLVYLGPAISKTHFEVGMDVLEAFFESSRSAKHTDQIATAFYPGKRPLHFYADIYALATVELNSLGVAHIYGGSACTFNESETWYSYRRDGVTGRMASLIWQV
jgi:YfiH family protein